MKRFLSFFICLILVFSLFIPCSAFAVSDDNTQNITEVEPPDETSPSPTDEPSEEEPSEPADNTDYGSDGLPSSGGSDGSGGQGGNDNYYNAVSKMVRSHWRDDYFSKATLNIADSTIKIDNRTIKLKNKISSEQNELMLTEEALGILGVELQKNAKGANVKKNGKTVELTYGDKNMNVNGRKKGMRNAPSVKNGDALIPESVLSEEGLGFEVDYNTSAGEAVITNEFQTMRVLTKVKREASLPDISTEQTITGPNGLYILQFSTVEEAKAACETLNASSAIVYAEPDGIVTIDEALPDDLVAIGTTPGDVYTGSDGEFSKVFKTNAAAEFLSASSYPHIGSWGTERIGADAYMDYLIANGKQNASVIVAVADTGLDMNHNLFVDRYITGYNFVDGSTNAKDDNGHGTHVSGIVVDVTIGLPAVKIMPVKIFDSDGAGSEIQIANGIRWASDNGAKIINMSFGGLGYSQTEKDAVDHAVGRGVICIAAAGNDDAYAKNFSPAGFSNVITVAATDISDNRASFSNYGYGVIDIAAPGVNILSSIPGGKYGYKDGTSMSAPHIAAAAAMLKLNDMNATPDQIKQAMCNANYGGFDVNYLGAGVLDFNALFGPNTEEPGVKLDAHSFDIDTMTDKYKLYKLRARVTPSGTANKGVTFTSDNPQVASVDNDGVLNIKGNGTARITARSDSNGLMDTCVINVNVANDHLFWIGSAADSFAGGDGTINNPYKIATPEQLALVSYNARLVQRGGGLFEDEYFELVADIDLNGKEWVSIVGIAGASSNGIVWSYPFRGHFYGNGHVIKNMKQGNAFSELVSADHGLMAFIQGEIRDLGIVDADQKETSSQDFPYWTGILSTYLGGGVVENCFTTGKTVGSSFILQVNGNYGTLSGQSTAVNNCYSTVKDAPDFMQSLLLAQMSNCYYYSNGNSVFVGDVHENSKVINSFFASDNSSSRFTRITIGNDVISRCYYSDNLSQPSSTGDLSPKPVSFFKEISNYTDTANWDSDFPWDFDNIWAIKSDINNGLPNLDLNSVLPANVTISPNTTTIHIGDTQQLKATVTPYKAANKSVTWSSSDKAVAVVDNAGFVTAVANGTATITAKTINNKTAKCTVTVTPSFISVTGISLNTTSATLTVGGAQYLSATLTPADATNKAATWSTNNAAVAAVDQNGLVTAVGRGTAVVTVTTQDGGFSASCTTAVKFPTAGSYIPSKIPTTGYKNTAFEVQTVGQNQTITSGNSKVIVVEGSTLNFVSAGKAKITIKYQLTNAKTGKVTTTTVTKTITVKAKVESITLSQTSATIARKGKVTLKANILPSDATNKTVTWKSSNSKVATVTSKGVVTGVGGGTAVITATTKDGGKTAEASITVTPIYPTAIKLNKSSVSLAKGKTFQLKATLVPSTTDFKTATYVSDNPDIATVDEKGKITAKQIPGSCTITATSVNGKVAYCKVTVLPQKVTSIKIGNTSSATVSVGQESTLTATVGPANADNKTVKWSSSNTKVAIVDENSGEVTFIAGGKVTIKATAQDGSKKSASKTFTVKPPKLIALTFDDGPYVGTTGKILDSLEKNNCVATFFVIGRNIKGNEELLLRAYENGNEVGNHTWNHPHLPTLTQEQIDNEIVSTNNELESLLGKRPTIMRPPYGESNKMVNSVMGKNNLPVIKWSVNTRDWATNDAKTTYDTILSNVKDGSIIVCHDLVPSTIEAIEMIIPELQRRGYKFVTVSQLFNSKGIKLKSGEVYLSAK